MPAPDSIRQLVARFADHAAEYHSGRYNETQLRREFLDPFFMALGWDVLNTAGYAEAYKDVVHEDSITVGGAAKAPDYAFRIGGVRKFFVEAKKPAVNLREDVHPAYQLRRYAWSAKLPLSILTDFEELAVYDCRQKPDLKDKPHQGRVMYFTYDQYIERWDELAAIFTPEAIRKGSFDRYAGEKRGKSGTADVDDAFLEEISGWRLSLARNLALRNPGLSGRELNYAVQMTIDRIIFLRICEARGIEPLGQLQGLVNGAAVYPRLGELYRRADERYNSGLFHFRAEKGQAEPPDTLSAGLLIDDKPLKEIIESLYYPKSPYEFSVLPADILGQVYEQFLGKVIRLTAGHRAEVEDKPEVRKAGGVFYTPTYIVEYIVRHTLGELLRNKTPGDVGAGKGEPLRVLDPACGSGSFLIGAYQYLLDWYLAGYAAEAQAWARRKNPPIYQDGKGEWRLTSAERKRILLEHIYGVDIDPQAVEVTKLSLLLKVLEGENEETLGRQLSLWQERALPDLGQNIRCGNSLIGPDYYEGRQMALLDEEEQQRVNAFDWQKAFPGVFKSIGRNLYLVTFVTHNSRISERMVEYGVKTGEPLILGANERYLIAQKISEAIKTHLIPVVGWNVLPDHVHMILAAESEKDLDEVVRKIKGFSSFAFQRSIGIEDQHVWAQKYHHELIVDQRMLENVYAYVMENHIKHAEQWGQELIDGWEGLSSSPSSPNKGLKPLVEYRESDSRALKPLVLGSCVTVDEACNQMAGGFDAVIGNPPYVRQESLGSQKAYFQSAYQTYHGMADLYTYFIERGIKLLRPGGLFSYIVANKWLRANYGAPLRRWLKTQHIEEIIDFGDLPVFEQATTYPCILLVQAGGQSEETFTVTLPDTLEFVSLDEYVAEHSFAVNQAGLADGGWALVNEGDAGLLEKLRKAGKSLGEYVNGQIFYGIKTGLNEAFVIDAVIRQRLITEDPRSAELIKPFLLGRDVKRYSPPQSERFIIFTRRGVNIKNFPAILKYLSQFKDGLMPKPRDWKGPWIGRKPGNYQWYELQDTVDYYGEFEKPKIIVPAIVQKASYYYDQSGYYSNDKTCIISTTDLYLLGILNSRVPDFVMHHIASTKQGGYFEYKPMYISKLPIRVIDFTNPADVKRHDQMVALVERMLELHKQLAAARTPPEQVRLQAQIEVTDRAIDRLVYELYGLTEEEIKVVEGG